MMNPLPQAVSEELSSNTPQADWSETTELRSNEKANPQSDWSTTNLFTYTKDVTNQFLLDKKNFLTDWVDFNDSEFACSEKCIGAEKETDQFSDLWGMGSLVSSSASSDGSSEFSELSSLNPISSGLAPKKHNFVIAQKKTDDNAENNKAIIESVHHDVNNGKGTILTTTCEKYVSSKKGSKLPISAQEDKLDHKTISSKLSILHKTNNRARSPSPIRKCTQLDTKAMLADMKSEEELVNDVSKIRKKSLATNKLPRSNSFNKARSGSPSLRKVDASTSNARSSSPNIRPVNSFNSMTRSSSPSLRQADAFKGRSSSPSIGHVNTLNSTTRSSSPNLRQAHPLTRSSSPCIRQANNINSLARSSSPTLRQVSTVASTTRSASPNLRRVNSSLRSISSLPKDSDKNLSSQENSEVMSNVIAANTTKVCKDPLQGLTTKGITSLKQSLPNNIHTRELLTTSVYNSHDTGLWITTINTSQNKKVTKQNAAKYLKAFSFQTEREARESAYANAPPKMLSFDEHSHCFNCTFKFAVLRRASHCRNCGVCICSACTVTWNKSSVPETYNMKNESSVKVCKTCHTLSQQFKKALLSGDYEESLNVYNSGNINLRCPITATKSDEIMFPIHCAAQGGSLLIMKWLVDVHFCPLKRIRTGNKLNAQDADELITTSKRRSVIDIALATKSVDMLRYLIDVKNLSLSSVTDLQITLSAFQAVIKSYPPLDLGHDELDDETTLRDQDDDSVRQSVNIDEGLPSLLEQCASFDDENSDSTPTDEKLNKVAVLEDDVSIATTVCDMCILCCDNTIDCVITPCGHQICCLNCSKHLTTCPLCNIECKFIRIFKP